MKRYKLKKDLPTFKAGSDFYISQLGNLIYNSRRGEDIVAYAWDTLAKFPSILTDWFEELPEEPKTVYELKEGDKYYSLSSGGVITTERYSLSTQYDDCRRIQFGNAFLTREEAEKELARRKAKQILLRDTKGFRATRSSGRFYYVSYDLYDRSFDIGHWETDSCGGELTSEINFSARSDAETSIKVHEKEWKAYLGVEDE